MTDLLVIAPHPDDEILGCGATMARYLREGKTVQVVYIGEGAFPGPEGRETIRRACMALGMEGDFRSVVDSPYQDQRFELYSRAEMADLIAKAVDVSQPATVLVPFYGDVNLDHRVVFEAAMVALRPTRDFIRRVACYETASSTEWGSIHKFSPNWYVEVMAVDLQKKQDALYVYESEMKPEPHPRNAGTLFRKACTRGSEVCAHYAEAFMIVREVERV